MAAAAAGLRASYHRLLDRIELMLPPRFRPFYNHPAVSVWYTSLTFHLPGICTQKRGFTFQPVAPASKSSVEMKAATSKNLQFKD